MITLPTLSSIWQSALDVVVDDINLHLEDQSAPSTVNFQNILDGADLVQCAAGPTHHAGHILDVVILQRTTRDTAHIDPLIISDHSFITAEFYIGVYEEPRTKETTRSKQLW